MSTQMLRFYEIIVPIPTRGIPANLKERCHPERSEGPQTPTASRSMRHAPRMRISKIVEGRTKKRCHPERHPQDGRRILNVQPLHVHAASYNDCPNLFSNPARYVLLIRVRNPLFITTSNSPCEIASKCDTPSIFTIADRCTRTNFIGSNLRAKSFNAARYKTSFVPTCSVTYTPAAS